MMNNTRPISEHSRQELYGLLWSTPASNLAAHFGISDVAIVKHCKKLNVPRPTRGYWAKVAAGHKPRKKPLPPTSDDVFKQAAQRRVPKVLQLPENGEPLLPLAGQLLNAINKAAVDDYKRTRLKDPTLPEATISKALAGRAAQAFHVLLKELETLGVRFRRFQGFLYSGYFERRRDRLYLTIAEDLVRPDGSKGVLAWQWPRENARPCGYLTFSFRPHRYHYNQDIKEWSESAKVPLGKALSEAVAAVRIHFLELQERGEREKIESVRRHAEWLRIMDEREREEAIQLQQEKERKHAEALAATVRARKAALLKSAKRWRRSSTLLEFIDECETRWKNQSGSPTAEQVGWLTWAREIASAISPFPAGYPEPANDGAFDPTSIPFGGPYPPTRKFA